jgi:4-aminobutyrate aminotransferase
MSNDALTATSDHDHLAPVWGRVTNLEVASGKGCYVTTVDGTEYLDFTSGIAVTSTGHCHPKVVAAIQAQAERFIHAQVNCYRHDLLAPLAAQLNTLTPASIDTFFFSNSGAEATEAAVKLSKQATKRPNVIVFTNSFHGRTHMTMAMTASKTVYRAGHAPLPSGVFVAPWPNLVGAQRQSHDWIIDHCIELFRHLLKSQTAPDETAAVVMEPVQGEGGYTPAPKRFIETIDAICKEHGIMFVADEVQSGFARSGKMFAIDHYDVQPDIMIMAKGIASGFPISAIGASKAIMDRWPQGSHGGTYGGNAMGCAAALATIGVLTEPGFIDNVNARGEQLKTGLREAAESYGGIIDIRGHGLMIGSQFADPARVTAVMNHCRDEGHLLLMNCGTYGDTLRWMPPLVVSESEMSQAVAALHAAMKATA